MLQDSFYSTGVNGCELWQSDCDAQDQQCYSQAMFFIVLSFTPLRFSLRNVKTSPVKTPHDSPQTHLKPHHYFKLLIVTLFYLKDIHAPQRMNLKDFGEFVPDWFIWRPSSGQSIAPPSASQICRHDCGSFSPVSFIYITQCHSLPQAFTTVPQQCWLFNNEDSNSQDPTLPMWILLLWSNGPEWQLNKSNIKL